MASANGPDPGQAEVSGWKWETEARQDSRTNISLFRVQLPRNLLASGRRGQAESLKLVRCPRSLVPTLVALPSMSPTPSAPFMSREGYSFGFTDNTRLTMRAGNCYLILDRMPSISSLRKARIVSVLTFPN